MQIKEIVTNVEQRYMTCKVVSMYISSCNALTLASVDTETQFPDSRSSLPSLILWRIWPGESDAPLANGVCLEQWINNPTVKRTSNFHFRFLQDLPLTSICTPTVLLIGNKYNTKMYNSLIFMCDFNTHKRMSVSLFIYWHCIITDDECKMVEYISFLFFLLYSMMPCQLHKLYCVQRKDHCGWFMRSGDYF